MKISQCRYLSSYCAALLVRLTCVILLIILLLHLASQLLPYNLLIRSYIDHMSNDEMSNDEMNNVTTHPNL